LDQEVWGSCEGFLGNFNYESFWNGF
jgi:hypothetical protein